MKNSKVFLGMFALALAFGLVIVGCTTPTGDEDATLGTIAAPTVTATPADGGIRLTWASILDAGSYSVYRKNAAGIDVFLGASSLDTATGDHYYNDLVSDTNSLAAATEYTYTVYAVSQKGSLGSSQTTEKATTTTIPAKGTPLAAPGTVDFTFDAANEEVTVTVTPASAGILPDSYTIKLYRGTSQVGYTGYIYYPKTKGSITWNPNEQQEGSYTVRAVGNGSSSYYSSSDVTVSASQAYAPLFGSSASLSTSALPLFGSDADASRLVGYAANISLSSIGAVSGVTYTIDRAPVDAAGNAGTYAPVTISSNRYDDIAVTFTVDVLGNILPSTVYDRGLTTDVAEYKYRLTAVRESQTQYKEQNSTLEVNPRDSIYGDITVGAGSPITGGTGYQVTPSLDYTDALQTGDKLVLYWVNGNSNSYQNGPYLDANIEFSKAELEAATIVPKTLSVTGTGSDAYVQAYLVFADGTRKNVEQYYNYHWNGTGSPGIQYVGGYSISGSPLIYYAKLYY
ncbi:hypothetical protein AGMMS4952_10810 [Spirochaetia bacterium]|nr:hypothetical protein AGMMS4952_10810 [Spirochaetia bacterium]